LCNLRTQDTRAVAGEYDAFIRSIGVTLGREVSGVEHGSLIASLEEGRINHKVSLLAGSFGNGSTTLDGRLIKSTGLNVGSTVGKISLAGLHESSASFDLMAYIVAGMSRDAGCQNGGDCERSKKFHPEGFRRRSESLDNRVEKAKGKERGVKRDAEG
jgi:hypothetical protein